MSDQQGEQFDQQSQDEQGADPGWLAAGSDEDAYIGRLGDVLERYPDLADEQNAARAVATATHFAHELGDPTLATHPAMLEAAHLLSERAAAEEAAALAAQPVDRAQEIIDAGPVGRKVLPF